MTPLRRIGHFFRYVRQYWTHHQIISIAKKSTLMESGKWYSVTMFVMLDEGELRTDEISLIKTKNDDCEAN